MMADGNTEEVLPLKDDSTDLVATNIVNTSARRKRLLLAFIFVFLICVIAISVAATYSVRSSQDMRDEVQDTRTYKKAQMFKNGAVASDSAICSQVGADILKKGGNAVDAAVATSFCVGTVNLHSCGIGGGGFMVIYLREKKKHILVDYRESAPASATEKMYVDTKRSSTVGGSAIGVPGNVKGLWTVHMKYGKMSWSKLLQPAINLAKNGFKITKAIDGAVNRIRSGKYKAVDSGLRKLFSNGKGGFLTVGDTLKNPALARTLEDIQKNNITGFYTGNIARHIIKDISDANGVMTLDDLKNYKVRTRKALKLKLPGGLTFTAMSAPSGGPIVTMILNIMSGFDLSKTKLESKKGTLDFYQKVIESMKFSYAQRGFLGDPTFCPEKNISKVENLVMDLNTGKRLRKKISLTETFDPSYYGGTWASTEDHGTAHMSVLAPNGDAVAATETINLAFGSKMYSESTGIIYNNEMDDFLTPGKRNAFLYPPSPANFIRPGKRPLSSMSPVIITDENGDVQMVTGASGGSRIIQATAQVILKKLLLNLELGAAVDSYRIYHQGIPNNLFYSTLPEFRPPEQLLKDLKQIGHKEKSRDSFYAVVQAIFKEGNKIFAKSDSRKGGKSAGF